MEERTQYIYERFRRLLPRSTDLVLLVLKGHLLIEERLQAMIDEQVEHPRSLTNARLTFYQKLRICQALLGHPGLREWRFLESLNSLRNRLAHNAEVSDVEEDVDRLINYLSNDSNEVSESPRRRATALKNAFMFACAVLAGISMQKAEDRQRMEGPRGN